MLVGGASGEISWDLPQRASNRVLYAFRASAGGGTSPSHPLTSHPKSSKISQLQIER